MVKLWNSSPLKLTGSLTALLLLISLNTPQSRFIKSVPVNAGYITTDHLRNFYSVDKEGVLTKFGPEGNIVNSYSQKRFGRLTYVDAFNPMKLLLFYPEFSTVVALTNDLSELAILDLKELGLFDVTAVSLARDNNFWVYDHIDRRLRKIDDAAKTILQSEDFSSIFSYTVKPNFIREKGNWIYVNDPELGILVFDSYATYYKTIPIKGLTRFQIINDQAVYFKDGKLKSHHLKTFEEQVVALPAIDSVLQVRLEKDMLYILKPNEVALYAY